MRAGGPCQRWILLFVLIGLAAGCDRTEPGPDRSLLFPTLAQRQDQLDTLRLRGAGNEPLVSLVKQGGSWRVAERTDWPADAGRISQYLFVLSQARRIEEKTANPKLYARIGVEPVTDAGAAGTELELSGAGESSRLSIGNEHPKFNSNYVRVDGQAQAWLTDLPVTFERDPAAWLDRRLIDLPLARISAVRIADSAGSRFSLSHRDDRFRLDDAPSGAMRDSQRGDELAGALDQLQFEDLAADDGSSASERELQFLAVDGLQVAVQGWTVDGRLWVRIATSLNEAMAAQWLAQSRGKATSMDVLRNQAADWNERFRGRRFLLPGPVAATLLLSHEAILAGKPESGGGDG